MLKLVMPDAAAPRVPLEMLPFVLAGAVPQLGHHAESLACVAGRDDEMVDLASTAVAQAEWCYRLYDRIEWDGVRSQDAESVLLDAKMALVQLAAVAFLIGSDDQEAQRLRATFAPREPRLDALREALSEAANRLIRFESVTKGGL